MRVLLAALALASLLALPGCLAPFRVHVDPDILEGTPGWVETPSGVEGSFPGTRSLETRYTNERKSDDPPPFPATLQVFSLRSVDRPSVSDLLSHAKGLVATAAADNSIELNSTTQEGARTLVSGVETKWFVRQGTTSAKGAVFDDDVEVRILGEVGHDGRSNTSILVVAIAQVSRTQQCPPLLPACTPTQNSEVSWIQLVGDGDGSVLGATSPTGFIDHLVTR